MWGCATPATWNQGGCHQVPRLPRRSGAASRASRRRLNPAQGRHPGPSVPRLPRKTTVNDGRCEVVPRLPREIKVDVTKCHACHAEVPKPGPPPQCHLPRLPRKTTVNHVFVWLCVVVSHVPRKTTVCVCVGVLLCVCHACHHVFVWLCVVVSCCVLLCVVVCVVCVCVCVGVLLCVVCVLCVCVGVLLCVVVCVCVVVCCVCVVVCCIVCYCMYVVCCDGGGGRRRRRRRSPGYRIKNKNPTQRCGEYWLSGGYQQVTINYGAIIVVDIHKCKT